MRVSKLGAIRPTGNCWFCRHQLGPLPAHHLATSAQAASTSTPTSTFEICIYFVSEKNDILNPQSIFLLIPFEIVSKWQANFCSQLLLLLVKVILRVPIWSGKGRVV